MHINDPFEARASGRLPENASIEDMLNLLDNDRGLSRALSGFSFLGKTREQTNQKTSPTPTKTPAIRTSTKPTSNIFPGRFITPPTTKPAPKQTPLPTPMIPRDEPPPGKTPSPEYYPGRDITAPVEKDTTPSISINVTGGDSSGGGGTSTPGTATQESREDPEDHTYGLEPPPKTIQESKPFPWIWIGLGAAALFFFMKKKSA